MQTVELDRVLVPVDFSERCAGVVKWATDMAGGADKVTVVHVLPPIAPTDPAVVWGAIDDSKRINAVRRNLTTWLAEHGLEGVQVETRVGSAGPGIVEAAQDLKADLIAMPSQQRGPKGLVSFGTVAERVVRTAPCAVWVAR